MERKEAALGKTSVKGACLALARTKLSPEDRIAVLEQQLEHMQRSIVEIQKRLKENSENAYTAEEVNKKELPIGLHCIGTSEKLPHPVILVVEEDGYRVGSRVFNSLSAAAEAVSGVRRSGWAFWRIADGRTLKEAFK